MERVQLVPPVGSLRMVLFSSAQKPLSPVLPTDWGTAVTSKEVSMSWLLTVTLLQLVMAKV